MPQSNEMFALPIGPAELCFDKNEFMKKTFSVDEFLHDLRNAACLEVMRDDLGIYLKVLRSAMIELINEDYGDFVSLSGNLTGLDESIVLIEKPLKRLQEEIEGIRNLLDANSQEIKECLEEKKRLRTYKKTLQCLSSVHKSIQKLTELNSQLGNDLNPDKLNRSALELISLNFNVQFCREYLTEDQSKPVKDLHDNLFSRLKQYFLNALEGNAEMLEHCLRIYATLDGFTFAEQVFQTECVRKYMDKIITESALQNSPLNLAGLYKQIIDFIPMYMKNILMLTHHNGKMKGFNFLINSYWKEVEEKIEINLSSIFAPGNPDTFYRKYQDTQEFLGQMESQLGDEISINRFHQTEHFKSFQTRWNLPVYFQIRFQEIAGTLETVLSKPLQDNTNLEDPFKAAHRSILKCWEDGIYIQKLFVRFWKLTLLIISRTCRWISETIKILETRKPEEAASKLSLIVAIYVNTLEFKKEIPEIQKLAQANLPIEISSHSSLIEKCIEDSLKEIDRQLLETEQLLVKEIIQSSTANIRQVNDIPRLYRKTNRDVPNKHCLYVDQMLEPVLVFAKNYSLKIGGEKTKELLLKTFSSITTKYFLSINEVLTSVQKTEESLRRLKNLREKNSNPSVASDRATFSDDDKIRLQLQVDVSHWVNEIEKLEIRRSDINKLIDLISLVEDVTKIKLNK